VKRSGLHAAGFSPRQYRAIRQAYRVLLQSRLNTSEALGPLEAEPMIPEVRGLVEFNPPPPPRVSCGGPAATHVTDEA
jgi:acyl-[acyl carrier protein]--UDP-N-acetylglucosamine O-acyltransferase